MNKEDIPCVGTKMSEDKMKRKGNQKNSAVSFLSKEGKPWVTICSCCQDQAAYLFTGRQIFLFSKSASRIHSFVSCRAEAFCAADNVVVLKLYHYSGNILSRSLRGAIG